MKIYYRGDDDGRCAAAIVYRELRSIFDEMDLLDFKEYNLDPNTLAINDFRKGEMVYIVDIALDDGIYKKVIKPAIKAGSKVVHIDHHEETLEYLKHMRYKNIMAQVTTFYKIGISGSLLAWVYSLMNEDERRDPNNTAFDFSEKVTHMAFNFAEKDRREYKIPDVIRFINDNDVQTFELEESKYFTLGFQSEKDKHPLSDVWNDLIYASTSREVYQLVNNGKIIWDYQEAINRSLRINNAFTTHLEGVSCFCINNSYDDPRIFGDLIDAFPMVCVFHYTGKQGIWHYSLYSSEKEIGVDVSEIAKKFGGDGQFHAAGFDVKKFIF